MVNFLMKPFTYYFLQTRTLASKSSITSQLLNPKTLTKNELVLSEKHVSFIAFLKKHHFSDAQIAMLVAKFPRIVRCNIQSILEPKLMFLVQNGFRGTFLTDVVVKNPTIFRRSLNDRLIPNFEYLRELLRNDQDAVLLVIKKSSWMLTSDIRKVVQSNIDLLLEKGMEMTDVLKHLTRQPRTLLCTVDRMHYAIEMVKKFGLKPTDNMFIYALRMVLSLNELNWKKKVDFLKSLGWSDQEIVSIVAHNPLCFTLSEDNLKRTFDFFVKTMDLDPKYLIKNPMLLTFSLHKRIIPRCKVVKTLKKKNLLEDLSIRSIINMTEDKFTTRFILKYPTLSFHLWMLYRGHQNVDDIVVQQ